VQRSINGSLHFLLCGDVFNSPAIKFESKKFGEIRGAESGQCIGAGSRGMKKSGKHGTWTIETHHRPAKAPDWLFGLISNGGKTTKDKPRIYYGDPIPWDEDQATRLVEVVEHGQLIKDYAGPFIEGERDNLTYQLFAEAKNRMIHPHAMLDAITETGIDNGLENTEDKMVSAYFSGNTQGKYGEKVPAYYLPNYVFKVHKNGKQVEQAPVDPVKWKAANHHKLPARFPGDPAPKPDATPQSYYYLGALDDIPEPTWAIEGLLPEGGYSLLYGKRSTKKSFLALDMGLSLAIGVPYHGRDIRKGRVVYFAGEGFRGNRRRISAWFNARKLNPMDYAKDFALVPFTAKWDTLKGRENIRQILSDIAKDGPIYFAIIDTARRAMSGDENAPSSVGEFLDGVSEVCHEFNCGHLIVHHAGKDESRGARGGGPFEDDADAVFHVTQGTNGTVKMKCTKQKDGEADYALRFRADKILLGCEPDGKAITSLALTLECETEGIEESTASSEVANKYKLYDATAIQILDRLQDPSVGRGALAQAVLEEQAVGLRDTNSLTLTKEVKNYGAHLRRLPPAHALWAYIDEKNRKGEPLKFRNKNKRGQRAAKPNRRGIVNYTPFDQEEVD